MTALDEIAAERRRQIEVEGWTAEHDDAHSDCDLIDAATCYLRHAQGVVILDPRNIPVNWPWDAKWWKPKSPRDDLVRAGALCLADQDYWKRNRPESPPQALPEQRLREIVTEIEYLDRAALRLAEEGR